MLRSPALFRMIFTLALVLAISPLQAEEVDQQLTEARNVFLQGVDGDKHAVRTAANRFRMLSRHHPDNPVYLAYFGASMTLQGRDAPNYINKRRLTEEGLATIDRALDLLSAKHDVNPSRYLDTLLVAANSFIHIPSFFNRYDRGKQLLRRILEHRDFDNMAPGFKAAAYMAAALVAHGEGDEKGYRRYLELTVKTDPEGRNGHFASKLQQDL
jgi:hypothetical protein